MEITEKLLIELQNRLKVGTRSGVHLNAIPTHSRYKFDLTRLSHIDKNLPKNFINALLTELPLKFKISWKDNVPDLNSLFKEDQFQLVNITKSFENLINQTDAIESEKGLNTFGFGFPILVRRNQSDNKLTVAPILIWSLRIKRTKDFNTWEIQRNEDDPIYINEVLINHLQNDSKIEIDQISSENFDDGLIYRNELLDICVNIIETINSTTPTDLRTTFEKKLNEIKPISDRIHYEQLSLNSNNAFINFSGLFSIFEVQKQNIIHDYENLFELQGATIDLENMDNHCFQPISSVKTDPSQQAILHALKASRNILIQGPPGTGKSQSLTAILVNALENHKKTIVVCEKLTALDVLKKALDKRELSNLNVLITEVQKTGRKSAVNSVRDRVDNSFYHRYNYTQSKETLDNIIKKSKSLIDEINKKHQKLDERLIDNQNWTSVVGSLLSELKNNSEDYNLDLNKDSFSYKSFELTSLLEIIRKGQNLHNDYKPFKALSFLNSSKLVGDNPFMIEQRIEEDYTNYNIKIQSINKKILEYEQEFYNIRKTELNHQEAEINAITDLLLEIFSKYENTDDFYNEEKTNGFFFKTASLFLKTKKSVINDQLQVNILYTDCLNKINASKDFQAFTIGKAISEKKSSLINYKATIVDIKNNFQSKIETEYNELNLLKSNEKDFETKTLLSIVNGLSILKAKICDDNWSGNELNTLSHKVLITSIEKLIEKKEKFFENENNLFFIEFKWFQYYNNLLPENRLIIDQLLEKEDWKKVFLIFYLNSLLVKTANMDLPTNDNDHIELGKSLSEFGKKQIKYIREYWFSKQIDATRNFENKNPNLAVKNLYNKNKSANHKRLSLREIVKLDMDLFTTFFPIILTTPDIASNLFKGQSKYFDIVMFDEASQLKLEDNLPALLKGKQIIIAGDEHQMPPSNYFSKVFDGTIDDEDEFEDEIKKIRNDASNSLLDCESLLEFGSELGFELRYLDFHYRSRHPYLIDYSNYAFYNQRLKPLPNSFDYIPINYIPVNGTYSDNSNDAEAEAVLSIIDNNISRLPNGEYPTIGVATFNIHQRNLILGKINERRKFERFNDFNDKIVELEKNGFFVKNLENIQGDERDVIILSTTYGKNIDGQFAQRFGSINHQKGYKLLNVIVTRAKYKVYVCSSIPQEVFLNYKEQLIKESSNNRRGAFYAYLAYAKAVSEQNEDARISVLNTLAENSTQTTPIDNFNADLESPFEEEVYEALKKHVDENKIIPQFQFAGFRIDMVYDPKHVGLPKIAIECDGAAYHSSQEAYLHDWHRQKTLEEHGFVFHRIWSTNWWINPKQETRKLVEFIENIENSIPLIFEDEDKTSLAFTDNLTRIENENHQIDLFPSILFSNIPNKIVELNSKVKIKYLNIDKDLTVHLVEQTEAKPEKINGIQKINIKSPLGIALKGKSEGDIVKIGDLDNYVRILEIEK